MMDDRQRRDARHADYVSPDDAIDRDATDYSTTDYDTTNHDTTDHDTTANHRHSTTASAVVNGLGTVVRGIATVVATIFGVFMYPLALFLIVVPFMMPFLIGDINGSYDANSLVIQLVVSALYLAAGFVFAGLAFRQHRRGHVPTAVLCAVLAVAGVGYGAVCTVADARTLATGPVTVAVGRPKLQRVTETDSDDAPYDVCVLVFTTNTHTQLSFDGSSCEDDGSINPNNRIVRDLKHAHSDSLLLRYYDALRGPIYVGLEDDPRYS